MKSTIEILKAAGSFFSALFMVTLQLMVVGVIGYGIIKLFDLVC